jgi:hypothetical protein
MASRIAVSAVIARLPFANALSDAGRFKAALARISQRTSTAEADPGMSTALRSVGLLNIPSSMSAGPSVALAEKMHKIGVGRRLSAAVSGPFALRIAKTCIHFLFQSARARCRIVVFANK